VRLPSPPDDTEGTSTSGHSTTGPLTMAAPSTPRRSSANRLPPSASAPPPRAAPPSGHVAESASDPGPAPLVNIIAATPPRDEAQRAREEAYQRLVKAERRRSPISPPRLFRRNSADVPAEASSSRTRLASPAPARHDSFDFEPPGPSAPADHKVRFMEPVPEGNGNDGDSGISGLRHEHDAKPARADSGRRASSQSTRARRAARAPSPPDTSALPRSAPSTGPLGTAYSAHGLPPFSFESTSPSPSMTSFSSRTSARTAPIAAPAAAPTARTHKGRSLDLGLGLAWAPARVRQEAVLGARAGKSKWGAGARTSEVLHDGMALGRSPKEDAMDAFKRVLDDPGYTTFKRCACGARVCARALLTAPIPDCRRYEVGALPLDGPTGVLGHLERLLETASVAGPQDRRAILEQFAQFARSS
jgi:hypothetical protein